MDKGTSEKYDELYRQRNELNRRMAELLAASAAMDVQDYQLKSRDGNIVRLSSAFGSHRRLLLVHNMGKHCPYCTLWADGFQGIWRHVESGAYAPPAAFLLVNNDTVEEQEIFAAEGGWDFPMLSARGTSLFRDLGFEEQREGETVYLPGVSALLREDGGRIRRVALAHFGPGDMYCSLFHLCGLFTED